MKMKKISLFEEAEIENLLRGIKIAEDSSSSSSPVPIEDSFHGQTDVQEDCTKCLSCEYNFASRESQVQHYKSDWHRYNLKLKLGGMPPVSVMQFEDIIDEISSLSGSGSESDDTGSSSEGEGSRINKAFIKIQATESKYQNERADSEKTYSVRSPKLCFQNADGQILSVYKCVLPYRNEVNDTHGNVPDALIKLRSGVKCCIILLNAGHFAAAVFDGSELKVHKTFHRYVLRAKQGSVQSVRDNIGNAPKSAGAGLRRHNEVALANDIQDLLNKWNGEHLASCSHIFLRAPHYNKSIFYSGKMAPLSRGDVRVRGIPFPTRRPTFNELKRVWRELYSVAVHDEDDSHKVATERPTKKFMPIKNEDAECLGRNNSKQPQSVESISPNRRKKVKKVPKLQEKSCEVVQKEEVDEVLTSQAFVKKVKKVSKLQEKSGETVQEEEVAEVLTFQTSVIMDELFTVCKLGDTDGLEAVVASIKRSEPENWNEIISRTETEAGLSALTLLLNQGVGAENESLLHVAAKAGHRDIVYRLLDLGADPGHKNKCLAVPYSVSSDKAMRNTFRKFLAEFPEKYDYRRALIPGPLTEEMELKQKQKINEKKKAQRAIKKAKLKEINAEKAKLAREKEEKERFAALSDREKRAVAAERRLARQIQNRNSGSSTTVKRCWLCGESLVGKIPFEYLEYQFCAMTCLKKHKALN